jgi:hypothetical protein
VAGISTSGLSPAAYKKVKATWQPWEYKGPKLLMKGEPMARTVSRVLASATDLTVSSGLGRVSLVPGTVWSGNKMLVLCQSMTVSWAVADALYEWGTQDFIRCEWLDAAGAGAAQAQGMRRLVGIEMQLLAGMFAPFYLILGTTVAKSAVFYYSNQGLIQVVRTHARQIIADADAIKAKVPTLYRKLRNTALEQLLTSFPNGVSPEDVAFFLGRVIRGASGAVDALELGQRLTLPALLKIAGVFATLVTITHSPSILLHGGEQALKDLANQIKALGSDVMMTEAELKAIAGELSRAPDAQHILDSAGASLQAIVPVLNDLAAAYKRLD